MFKNKVKRSVLFAFAAVLLAGSVAFVPKSANALTVWSESDVPAVASDPDTAGVELGMKFRSSVATNVTGVRFYKGSGNTGTHTGSLWTSSGVKLATVTFSNETASGWQQANFANPIGITANTTYVISYYAPNGHYSVTEGHFANSSYTNGTLTALQNGVDGGNGVYKYGSTSAFPNQTYASSNYWVDVIANNSTDTVPPTVAITTPPNGATLSGSVTLEATASDNVAVSSVQFKLDGVNIGASDTTAPYSVVWNSALTQNGTHVLTALATDTGGNITTSSSVTVSTNNAPLPTSSLWSNSQTPAVTSENDSGAVELGMKFRSSQATSVVGLKFYKGAGNTGTHIGNLWSSTGANLGTVTFSNETASGWQEATFASPIPIAANTTYVISYFAPAGHYAVNEGYFSNSATVNGSLTGLQSTSAGGNGVYRYANSSVFPNSTYAASNYWVDVLVANTSDTTAPTVTNVAPLASATDVATDTLVQAILSESLNAQTVNVSSVTLKNSLTQANVAATVAYDSGLNKVTLTPSSPLENATQYTATLTTAITDASGNALASNYSWNFTTQIGTLTPVDPLSQGHDGPILIVTDSTNPFSGYYAEILRAEGLNSFKTVVAQDISAPLLSQYDVVLLGEVALSQQQADTLSAWVNGGGNLIAMRPDKKLASLLGLTDQSATMADSYLQVNTTQSPGTGIVGETIQYHGSADLYTAQIGTETVATLYSTAADATPNPAVTVRSIGTNGGAAASFTYDLAKSVVYSHQGNPAWSGDERDGSSPIRPNDLFYGAKAGDPQPDYVNLSKVSIPQADEQQRLLANMIADLNTDKKPLPKFGYFPYNKKAVVVLVADDHATATGTISALDYQLAQSNSGCVVEDWECIRSTSLIYTQTPVTDAQALSYYNQGFDFGVHASTGCNNWTTQSLTTTYSLELSDFQSKFSSLPAQHVNRIHCIAWSSYAEGAKVGAQVGLRQDLNYYYWPGSWVQNRPGFMTGSGMNMRYADLDGSMIDVYQLPSHLVNESGQTFPQNIDIMLSRATGPEGYYGALGTHYDYSDQFDRQLVQSAKAYGVPLVSGQQMLDWTDARNNSYYTNTSWSGANFSFTANVDTKARGMMRGLLPYSTSNGILLGLSKNGQNVTFSVETIKGVSYAVFPVTSGTYTANYGQDVTPPAVSSITPLSGATGVNTQNNIEINFNEPLDPTTVTSANVQLLDGNQIVVASTVSYQPATNKIVINPDFPLAANTSYTVLVSQLVLDANGVALAQQYTSQFTTGIVAYSFWAPNPQTVSTATDADVELGIQFTSSQSGTITKIHYYRGVSDGLSTHTMTLWDNNGVALGTAATNSESSSGWQTATFSAPIAITAGTTYTASYRASGGSYAFTAASLSSPVTSGPIATLVGGGVYRYGGGFPTSTFNNNNYWVDVTFAE